MVLPLSASNSSPTSPPEMLTVLPSNALNENPTVPPETLTSELATSALLPTDPDSTFNVGPQRLRVHRIVIRRR